MKFNRDSIDSSDRKKSIFEKNSFLNKKFKNDKFLGLSYVIMAINFAMALAFLILKKTENYEALEKLINWSALIYGYFIRGKYFWTPITFSFITTDFFSLFFYCLLLWFFGLRYEREIGSKEFIFLYLSSSIVSSLAVVLTTYIFNLFPATARFFPSFILAGSSASIFALFFITSYYHRFETIYLLFVIPIKLPFVVFALLLLDIIYLLINRNTIANVLLDVYAILYAISYAKLRLRLDIKSFFRNMF